MVLCAYGARSPHESRNTHNNNCVGAADTDFRFRRARRRAKLTVPSASLRVLHCDPLPLITELLPGLTVEQLRATQHRLAKLSECGLVVAVGSGPKDPGRKWLAVQPTPSDTAGHSTPVSGSSLT
jgi:hypothetical protein